MIRNRQHRRTRQRSILAPARRVFCDLFEDQKRISCPLTILGEDIFVNIFRKCFLLKLYLPSINYS